jgi:hypothetical protein
MQVMQSEVSLHKRKLLLTAAFTLLLSVVSVQSRAQDDPPMQAGRLSYISGSVSFQPAGLDDWGQAQTNLSLGPGDRIFTDSDGRAEIQIGYNYIRVGPNTDLSIVEDDPDGISIGVAQGSVHVRCNGVAPGQPLFVNTPSGTATFKMVGEMRIDVLADQGATVFTGLLNDQLIDGAGGFNTGFRQGETLELAGTNPVVPQWLAPGAPDDLDIWSRQRDQQIVNAASWRYVSPEVAGAEDLDANGSWIPGTPYGAIWFPNVDQSWAPYHYGRWVNHAPWGPVWIEDEPWGYAPFHYGRWVVFQGRWGWVPGPREEHPVWSPALVVFAGGIQVGGAAVSAWFPLGPGEPYRPWYPCSPRYVDRVNISNMAEGPRVHVLTTYAGFDFGGFAFSLRRVGVTAMRQEDFAAGRPVRQANVVVNVNVIQHITVIERPVIQINQRVIVERPPSRPVPVAVVRPTLINNRGLVVSARAGFHPVAAPVRPAPQVHVLPGRQVVAPPPNSGQPGGGRVNGGQPGGGQFSGGQPGNNRPGYQPVTQQPQPDIPTGQRMHKPATQPEEQPQQQPQPDIPTGQRMHKPATQPEEQPTNNPPAHNNNAAPGNGSAPQAGAHQGNNQGNGNEHGGKPEDHKNDKKDDRKDDKPHDKSDDK